MYMLEVKWKNKDNYKRKVIINMSNFGIKKSFINYKKISCHQIYAKNNLCKC